jgi:hypothetical protein
VNYRLKPTNIAASFGITPEIQAVLACFQQHYAAIKSPDNNLNSDSVLKIIVEDFEKIYEFLETLYINGRLQLPLKGIVLIGY